MVANARDLHVPQIDHVQVHEITEPRLRNVLSDSREFDKSAAC
jgi:hypothetical protein